MDKCTHEVRLEQWRKIVEACSARPKGMTIRQWLSDHDINEKAYYYWQRKVRQSFFDTAAASLPAVSNTQAVGFAELRIRRPSEPLVPDLQPGFRPDVIIQTASAVIALSNTVSDKVLSAVMKEVRRAK